MMNKKRSRAIGRTKYLMFLPLVAILMLLSNIEAVARITKNLAETVSANENITVIVNDVADTFSAVQNKTVKVNGTVKDTGGNALKSAKVTVKGQTTGTVTDAEGKFTLEVPANATLTFSMTGLQTDDIIIGKEPISLTIIMKPAGNQPKRTVYTLADKMPRFPGGEEELLKFISRSIKYPVDAQNEGKQGRVIARFVVNVDGTISDVEILRGVYPSIDVESVRVIKSMPTWEPGEDNGKKVPVQYTIPLTYRLSGGSNDKPGKGEDGVYNVADEMPSFPGGARELLNFISKSLKYPVTAFEKGIEGTVVYSFVVNEDGTLRDFKLLQGIDAALDKEALRILSSSPKWTPGKVKGEIVPVKYTVPVSFRLNKAN